MVPQYLDYLQIGFSVSVSSEWVHLPALQHTIIGINQWETNAFPTRITKSTKTGNWKHSRFEAAFEFRTKQWRSYPLRHWRLLYCCTPTLWLHFTHYRSCELRPSSPPFRDDALQLPGIRHPVYSANPWPVPLATCFACSSYFSWEYSQDSCGSLLSEIWCPLRIPLLVASSSHCWKASPRAPLKTDRGCMSLMWLTLEIQ